MKTLLFVLLLSGCACLRHPLTAQAPPAPPPLGTIDDTIQQMLTYIDVRAVCQVPRMGLCFSMRDPQREPIGRDTVRKWMAQFSTSVCCQADQPCHYSIVHRGTYTIYCQSDQMLYSYTVPIEKPGVPPTQPMILRSSMPKPGQ